MTQISEANLLMKAVDACRASGRSLDIAPPEAGWSGAPGWTVNAMTTPPFFLRRGDTLAAALAALLADLGAESEGGAS